MGNRLLAGHEKGGTTRYFMTPPDHKKEVRFDREIDEFIFLKMSRGSSIPAHAMITDEQGINVGASFGTELAALAALTALEQVDTLEDLADQAGL